jgi:hypothetical protein
MINRASARSPQPDNCWSPLRTSRPVRPVILSHRFSQVLLCMVRGGVANDERDGDQTVNGECTSRRGTEINHPTAHEGPRSLIRTVTDRPLPRLTTVTRVPKPAPHLDARQLADSPDEDTRIRARRNVVIWR